MKFVRLALAALAALSATTAFAAPNWLTVVNSEDGGHRIGNPGAKVKLTEFVSYTCSHCGSFFQQAGNALDLYVATGKVQIDVRHVVRDPVDLTAAMLANCGPAVKFARNHAAIMRDQPRWLPISLNATAGQRARWYDGPAPARRRAIASDLKFYDLMVARGYTRPAVDQCLSDATLAKRLADQSAADNAKWKVAATPSFAIDGTMLAGTYSWDVLQPQLDARL